MGWFGGGKKQGASPSRRLQKQRRAAGRAAATATAMPLPSAKNAAPKREPKVRREQPSLQWRALGMKVMPALAASLVLGLLIGGWQLLEFVGSVPVSRVAVTGSLLHTDRNQLIERVRPLLAGEGFMTVDLQRIRAAVMALPWIANASVERQWPDRLVIAVTEQEPIARWGSDGLLNRAGEVFRPQPLGDVSQLPELFGPDELSAEVIDRYAELRALLAAQNLKLASFGVDARGSWSATLHDGVALHLGTGDVLKKMRSFSRVYRADLSTQMDRIAYIDLRYGNGVAVGWKQSGADSNDNKATNSGVSGHG